MKKWLIAIVAGLLALAIVGVRYAGEREVRARFLRAVPDALPADAELMAYAQRRGAVAYEKHCATCHGAQLEGDRLRAIPNLADDEWLYGSGRIGEIERVVLYGIRSGHSKGWDLADMPAYARRQPYRRYKIATLLPREIDDVAAYVRSFQAPPSDAAAAERGAKLFAGTDKGACWDCHGDDAKGDTAIGAPDLTDDLWLTGDGSQQSIHDAIAFGLAGSCPSWIARLPPATIRALAVHVYSRHGENQGP